MSDPMTNSEVEDVLSSIRRLVSDEKRAEPAAPEPPKAVADRLVLTPSLRVPEAGASDDIPSEDDATTDPEHADPGGEVDARAVDGYNADASLSPAPLILDATMDVSNSERDTDDAESGDPLDTDELEVMGNAAAGGVEAPSGSETETPETLGEKIAALETLIAGRVDDWEPDQVGTGENAGTEPPAMDWEASDDNVRAQSADSEPVVEEDDQLDETREPLEPPPEAEASPVTIPGDDVLDQDALRALVSEIVRQELQGPLGERITRNVRKLVRRELHRALTSKDLE